MKRRFSLIGVAVLMAISFTLGTWLPEPDASRRKSTPRPPAAQAFKYPTVAAGKVTIHEPGLYGIKCASHLTMKVHSEFGHTVNIRVTKK
ncbi:MAG: hypothetical protein [Olavius algarvensis Delta 4 endosymbiont]|nr:MAG: hypothetical protein [Olavius algarvensis Delta 4 endosymbiont]